MHPKAVILGPKQSSDVRKVHLQITMLNCKSVMALALQVSGLSLPRPNLIPIMLLDEKSYAFVKASIHVDRIFIGKFTQTVKVFAV